MELDVDATDGSCFAWFVAALAHDGAAVESRPGVVTVDVDDEDSEPYRVHLHFTREQTEVSRLAEVRPHRRHRHRRRPGREEPNARDRHLTALR